MNMMITEVYDALIDAGAQELKARDAARVLADLDLESRDQFSALREDNQAMRTEMADLNGMLRREMSELRSELKRDGQAMQGQMTTLKWMFGVAVAVNIAIALRLFTV